MKLKRAQPWLGTIVEISAEGVDNAAIDAVFARIADIHSAMSFQAVDSELSRVNQIAQHEWIALSPDLAAVFECALEIALHSGGLFDPSMASALVRAGRLPRHPGFSMDASVDFRAIEFDGARVRYARPLLVDFSGIAKGYAVDVALSMLRDTGATSGMVNAGGDLACFGASPWPLHVRDPRSPGHLWRLVQLRTGAVATSANYFQPGMLLHPHSGEILNISHSVTVLAGRCMIADALAKVVAADPVCALPVLARHGAEAFMLDCESIRYGHDGSWRYLPLECAA